MQLLAEYRANRCRVCGNATRVLILWLLAEKERTLEEIVDALKVTPIVAARHLRILAFSQMINMRKEGRNTYYRINESEAIRNCPVLLNKPG